MERNWHRSFTVLQRFRGGGIMQWACAQGERCR